MPYKLLIKEPEWKNYQGEGFSAEVLPGAVHVFRIDAVHFYDELNLPSRLSAEEFSRFSRFIHEEDRKSYAVSKYMLRHLLSKFIHCQPEEITYDYLKNNKPHLKDIAFNLSHTKRYIFIAVAERSVGIDTEYIRDDFDYAPVADSFFHKKEQLFMSHTTSPVTAFYTLWTRKEALLKATGEGLIDQMNQFSCLDHFHFRNMENFKLLSFKSDEHWMVSLAYHPDVATIHFRDYSSQV